MTLQPVTIPCGDITLEGELLLFEGRTAPLPAVVVCHPHPLYGGDMTNVVVREVCAALLRQGMAALRFNFRGTGRSTGRHSGGDAERHDVRAALDLLAAQEAVDADRLGLAGYSFGAVVALATEDPRVRALAAVSPAPVPASAPQRPTLLVTGDVDPYVSLAAVEALAGQLRPLAQTVVVPGADHFWSQGLSQAAAAVAAFLAGQL